MSVLPTSAQLRLSALRAFMGEIGPDYRLVKIKAEQDKIILSVVLDSGAPGSVYEAISVAATEIIADFPSFCISENVVASEKEIESEDIITEGWVFRRKEKR